MTFSNAPAASRACGFSRPSILLWPSGPSLSASASLRDRHRSNPPQRSRSRPESGVSESAASASSPWEIPANSRLPARLLVYNARHRTLSRGRTSRPGDVMHRYRKPGLSRYARAEKKLALISTIRCRSPRAAPGLAFAPPKRSSPSCYCPTEPFATEIRLLLGRLRDTNTYS